MEQIRLIDCSRAGLESTPQPKKRIADYMTLSLRHNLLLEVNFTLIMEKFPYLKTVDIWNNPIYCKGVGGGGTIKALTDYNASKPTTHHRTTTKISLTNRPKLIHNLTQSFHIHSTTSAFTDPDLPSTVYLTTLTTSNILIPLIILCPRIVLKLLVTRRGRQRNVMPSFKMISFNLETSSMNQRTKSSLTLLHCKDCL